MLEQQYERECRRKTAYIAVGLVMIVFFAFAFSVIGMDVPVFQSVVALKELYTGNINDGTYAAANKIIVLLRMPRILLAIIAGVGLSVAGSIMQSITRNYLVSPFTLGVSSAAAFGASMCIVFGTSLFFQSEIGIISCAFLASCCCGCIVYGLANKIGVKPSTLVLVGIALNYLFSAMTATIEFFAKEHKLEAVVQWTFGSFNKATWENVLISFIVVAIASFVIWKYSLILNVMASNNDEMARSLGVNTDRIRTYGGLLAILITSTVISFTGVIGFVGLIAPHMARFIIGTDHRFYIPFSGILGAILLLVSDTFGKLILYPVNIPVGIVVSFLGVPLFVHLVLHKSGNY